MTILWLPRLFEFARGQHLVYCHPSNQMACVSAYAMAQNGHGNRGRTDLLGFAGPRLTAWLSHENWQRVAVPTRRERAPLNCLAGSRGPRPLRSLFKWWMQQRFERACLLKVRFTGGWDRPLPHASKKYKNGGSARIRTRTASLLTPGSSRGPYR